MLQSWKEVLPGDHYRVETNGLLHSFDQRVITLLYQPLIGIEAASLYFTLWQEVEFLEEHLTHHHLMGSMNLSLDRILKARKKLEAVGLLESLKKKEAAPGQFVYRLEPPLTPNRFFKDGFLNLFLYRQIGAREYKRLAELFAVHRVNTADYEDVSASFDEVFKSVPASETIDERNNVKTEGSWAHRATSPKIGLKTHFDFKQMMTYLSDAIVEEDALTEDVRQAIDKLAFVYRTEPYDMSKAVQAAALHTGEVDIDALRKEVRDFYLLEHGADEMPALYERRQPESQREFTEKEPQTEEEQLIAWYERNSPYQLLEALGQGSKPAAPDLRLIENLMFDTKINPGVINVLIDYISQVNDHKLNKAFVEKVAAQWARANVTTVRQAMNYAREEQKKRKQTKKSPATRAAASARTSARKEHQEVIPEWMKRPKKTEKQTKENEEAVKQRAKWLEDYLNQI